MVLMKWKKWRCDCPRGQIEQRDFEISPRLVKKTAVFASFRLQPSFHVFSDVQFIFMFCFYDPFGFCNLEVMTSLLGIEAFEFKQAVRN